MAQTITCRVCGKEYAPCKSAKNDPRVFNWREVSCSPDCGQVYLERIIASRTPDMKIPAEKITAKKSRIKKLVEIESVDIDPSSEQD